MNSGRYTHQGYFLTHISLASKPAADL